MLRSGLGREKDRFGGPCLKQHWCGFQGKEEVKRREGIDAATPLLLCLQGNFSYGALLLSMPTAPEWVGWGPADASCLCPP